MSVWQIFFTIAYPFTLACITIYLTNRNANKTTSELGGFIDKTIKDAKHQVVECIERDLRGLGESALSATKATLDVIQADGNETRKAIKEDGQQTREAIKATVKK